MTTLILLAHQDDEIGVMHEIAETLARGQKVCCAYLTNGAWAGVSSERRNAESRAALARLGVGEGSIRFLGGREGIGDGQLIERLDVALDALVRLAAEIGDVERILVHAYEGGHHDHDAAHVLGVTLARRLGITAASRQFPLYRRSERTGRIAFKAPLPSNGPVERHPIPLPAALGYVAAMRHYPSQLRVMLQLAPHAVRDLLVDRCQKLQPLDTRRLTERPNAGTMLYETWGLYTYQRFRQAADAFIAAQLNGRASERGTATG